MESVPETGSKFSNKKRIFLIATNLLSLACLWWVLHDINWRESWVEIRQMNWWWVSLAVVSDVVVYVFHGWRWSLLLCPVESIPVMRSIRAIYVGLFANEVLPLRTGEVLRCYLQARWSSIPFSVTLASAFIERIFDGFWLVLCLFITVRFVPGLPRYVMDGAAVLAVLIIAGALLVAIAMFHRQRAKSALSEHGWHRHLRVLIDDLHMIGHSKYLYYSALATIPYLLMQIVPFYALMHAYDFGDASWGVAAVLMIVLRLGSAVPQAPGNVGAFQALAVVLLSHVFGYDTGFAKRFSVVLWAVVTLPLLIVGFFALVITGARIGELSRRAKAEIPVHKD